MQGELSATDRGVLWWAAAIFVLLALATIRLAPRTGGQSSPLPSSYSYSSEGSRAAFLLLQKSGFAIRRWEEPPLHFAELGGAAMLILAEPNEFPSNAERRALLRFVRNGGRILFCGGSLTGFFGSKLSAEVGNDEPRAFQANLPSALSRGAETIWMRPRAFWGKLDESQLPIFGGIQAPVVVKWRIGAGELIWWAAATPLTNEGIRKQDNLQLFLNAVSRPDRRMTIYWDEYFHGERGSLWSYIGRTPVRWGLLQLLLIALGAVFTFSRRSGPVIAPAPVSRLAPLEFVDTLGGLYQHARATAVAVDVTYRQLRLQLARKLALPATLADDVVAQAAAGRLGWDRADFTDLLQRAAIAAQPPDVPWRQGLEMVRGMQTYVHRLTAPRPDRPERE